MASSRDSSSPNASHGGLRRHPAAAAAAAGELEQAAATRADAPAAASNHGLVDTLLEPLSRGCNACRITGTATFAGVSGYMLFERARVERAARGHRAFLAVLAAASASAAVVRWFT